MDLNHLMNGIQEELLRASSLSIFPQGSWFWVLCTIIAVAVSAYFLKSPKKKEKQGINITEHFELLEKRLKEFTPQPLGGPLSETEKLMIDTLPVVTSQPSKYITIIPRSHGETEISEKNELRLINFASTDILGFATDPSTKLKAEEVLNKYGCGSCGPRGFYGTFDVHLELEKKLAQFFGTEAAIVYSDAFTTAPSVIAAFSARGDYLIVDEGCNDSILNGCHLSRSEVLYFKHNDMESLEKVLAELDEKVYKIGIKEKGKKKAPEEIRRTIITEGIFRTTGVMCDIEAIVDLRSKYKVRLLLDESLSVGVLGATGHGVCEQNGVSVKNVDFLVGSLDNVFGSIGGFCVGSDIMVEQQRLMGAGYCFSAAVAPFLSATAVNTINMLNEGESKRVASLRKNTALFFETFKQSKKLSSVFDSLSCSKSSIFHLKLKPALGKTSWTENEKFEELKKLKKLCEKMQAQGVFLVCAALTPREIALPWLQPNIKISITASHDDKDIMFLISSLEKCADL